MNLLPPDPAQSQTPVNLLIVDDVPQNLVAMQALLQREGEIGRASCRERV